MFAPRFRGPRLAVVLSMIVHEIATNCRQIRRAVERQRDVAGDWEILDEATGASCGLIWTEAGGPTVTAPVQRGFGSRLIERSARDQLGGEATARLPAARRVYTVYLRARQGRKLDTKTAI